LFTGSAWGTWRDYFIARVPPGAAGPAEAERVLGAVNATAFFPTRYETVLGERPGGVTLEPATPVVVEGQLIIGGPGAGRGQFSVPAGISLDAQRNLYVADSQNHRIQKFDAEGEFLGVWGAFGGGEGQFNEPWGVAVDSDGNIYVADTWNHRIQKFDADFQFVGAWGGPFVEVGDREPEPLELFGPRDITVDGEGNLWVTDTGNKRVLKFSPDGEVMGAFGREGDGRGEFREPVGIDAGPAGDIYVADAWNRRIQRFDSDFNYLGEFAVETWGSQEVTAKPYLTVLDNGDVIAGDPANGNVLIYSGDGELLATWGLPAGPGGLGGRPVGIVAVAGTEVFVSDGAASEVRRLPISTIMSP
jgi:DNA-binding beta-propeller fold protein YncE